MIVHDVEQGTPEWHRAHLGIPTASQFDRLVTPKTMRPSASATGYLHELLAAWALDEPIESASTAFMARGLAAEAEAVRWFEFQRDVDTTPVGFVTTDDGRVGCSPDRLVGDAGGLEIKTPSAKEHIAYLLGDPIARHVAQVQGSMFVTGREWWDLLIYHPTLPSALVRVTRDDAWMEALNETIPPFLARLDAAMAKLRALGCRT